MLSSIFHTHFYENGYSTVFLDYKFCFFSSETCCDFQGDLYKAIKVKRKAGTLGLVTNEKSQASLFRVCIVHFPATTPLVSVLL